MVKAQSGKHVLHVPKMFGVAHNMSAKFTRVFRLLTLTWKIQKSSALLGLFTDV